MNTRCVFCKYHVICSTSISQDQRNSFEISAHRRIRSSASCKLRGKCHTRMSQEYLRPSMLVHLIDMEAWDSSEEKNTRRNATDATCVTEISLRYINGKFWTSGGIKREKNFLPPWWSISKNCIIHIS